jgi:hypothetical protein
LVNRPGRHGTADGDLLPEQGCDCIDQTVLSAKSTDDGLDRDAGRLCDLIQCDFVEPSVSREGEKGLDDAPMCGGSSLGTSRLAVRA